MQKENKSRKPKADSQQPTTDYQQSKRATTDNETRKTKVQNVTAR